MNLKKVKVIDYPNSLTTVIKEGYIVASTTHGAVVCERLNKDGAESADWSWREQGEWFPWEAIKD